MFLYKFIGVRTMKQKRKNLSAYIIFLVFLSIVTPAFAAPNNSSSLIILQKNPTSVPYDSFSSIYDIISQVNTTRLQYFDERIQSYGPHPTGSDALEQVKNFLYNELANDGLTVKLDPWNYKFHKGENIEATLPGVRSPNNIFILCAHYDGIAISPAADDDGSGVSTILTLAEIMSQYSFNSTVRFVLFSGEEQGLLGSHEYAKQVQKNKENIVGVIALDGIGYANSVETGSTVWDFANENAEWMVHISQAIAQQYSSIIDLHVSTRPNIPVSDQQSFIDKGFVANCFLADAINPFYHTSEDTFDHMNFTYLTKVCRLIAGTIVSLAEIHRTLTDNDISIHIKGTLRLFPDLFTIRVENTGFQQDTANLTIHIELQNLFTGNYLKQTYNITTNWTTEEEVGQFWEFIVGPRIFTSQFVRLTVTIEGIHDDVGLYKKVETRGLLIRWVLLLLPFAH